MNEYFIYVFHLLIENKEMMKAKMYNFILHDAMSYLGSFIIATKYILILRIILLKYFHVTRYKGYVQF